MAKQGVDGRSRGQEKTAELYDSAGISRCPCPRVDCSVVSGTLRLPGKCVLDSNVCEAPVWAAGSSRDKPITCVGTDWNRWNVDQRVALGPDWRRTETLGTASSCGGRCLFFRGNGDAEDAGRSFALACHNWSCLRVSRCFLVHANENAERNSRSGNFWF